jgi:hypothetical protein
MSYIPPGNHVIRNCRVGRHGDALKMERVTWRRHMGQISRGMTKRSRREIQR